jgi:hypothetical protein
MSRETYRQSARTWIEHAKAKSEASKDPAERNKAKRPLGIDKVIHTDFNARPKAPANSGRPYAFGSAQACTRYKQAVVSMTQEHAELSRRYRDGERMLRFPDGMYPPPLIQAG